MSDLVEFVEKNKGLIKKIQLIIPGYRGYRLKEDLRETDSLLRSYISKTQISPILGLLEDSRAKLVQSLELSIILDVADLIARVKTVDSKISHAEQGYSGISPTYRVGSKELYTLYEFDLNLIDNLGIIRAKAESINQDISLSQYKEAKNSIEEMKRSLNAFESFFEMRKLGFIKIMTGDRIEVGE